MQQRYPYRPHPHPNFTPHPTHGEQMYHQPNYMTYPPQAQYAQPDYMPRQITIEDAIGIAREQVSGQVVQAELERRGGRLIYEVDIISNQGPKYEVKVDASTGEVIEVELD